MQGAMKEGGWDGGSNGGWGNEGCNKRREGGDRREEKGPFRHLMVVCSHPYCSCLSMPHPHVCYLCEHVPFEVQL